MARLEREKEMLLMIVKWIWIKLSSFTGKGMSGQTMLLSFFWLPLPTKECNATEIMLLRLLQSPTDPIPKWPKYKPPHQSSMRGSLVPMFFFLSERLVPMFVLYSRKVGPNVCLAQGKVNMKYVVLLWVRTELLHSLGCPRKIVQPTVTRHDNCRKHTSTQKCKELCIHGPFPSEILYNDANATEFYNWYIAYRRSILCVCYHLSFISFKKLYYVW